MAQQLRVLTVLKGTLILVLSIRARWFTAVWHSSSGNLTPGFSGATTSAAYTQRQAHICAMHTDRHTPTAYTHKIKINLQNETKLGCWCTALILALLGKGISV